jgi:hypothetical protein
MKHTVLLMTLLMAGTFACQQKDPLTKATILGTDPLMCGCCGGWFIQIDSVSYRTYQLPDAFAKANTPVWIRYHADESSCAKLMGNTIIIDDIRTR